ncbi:MAG: lipopolysaccharide biosynthesis protein [Bacteroidales bacterium]|nr:lipopolysaccharide biosynthesis protein [Bacteroidales bacterium]
MEQSELKAKTARGLLWGGLNNGVQQLISVVLGLVLLNKLSPADYGLVGMLAIFIGVANTLQEGGFTSALTNRPQYRHEDFNAVFWFSIAVSLSIYSILWFCAPLIADFFGHGELVLIARVQFLTFVFNSMSIAHNAFLFKNMMVRQRASYDLVAALVSAVIAVWLALGGYGYWALVVHSVSFSAIGALLKWSFVPWKPSLHITMKPVREMLGFSVNLVASSLITQVQTNIFSIILGKKFTKQDVGYYSQGMKWSNLMLSMFTGIFVSVSQPVFSEISCDRERQLRVFRKLSSLVSLMVFPVMLGIAFVGNEFISLINPEFLPCVPVLQTYCVYCIASAIYCIYTQLAISHGLSRLCLKINTANALAQIAAALISYRFGMVTMAVTVTVINYAVLLAWHFAAGGLVGFRLGNLLGNTLPYLLLTAVALALAWVASLPFEGVAVVMMVKIAVAAALYLTMLYMFNKPLFLEAFQLMKRKRI